MAKTGGLWATLVLASCASVACAESVALDGALPGAAPSGGQGGAAGGGAPSSGGVAGAGAVPATGGAPSGGGTGGATGATGGGAGAPPSGGGAAGSAGAGGPSAYTIGGTVNGLLGSGLKLTNNGGDEISVGKDGTFAFPTKVGSGKSYAATVSAQPQNPAQSCSVEKGNGKVASIDVDDVAVSCVLLDGDGDKVPDVADPFPNDPSKPKLAQPNLVYPHTASKLFTMDVKSYAVTEIGSFKGSGYWGSMTDLAVDQWGVIYGVTFGDLWTCDADTATCHHLATLPQTFNGMTLLPPGTHHPYLDTLVGIAISGTWYKISLSGGTATLSPLGAYGGGYSSSGDAFSIDGVGTFASVDKPCQGSDVIVSVDPLTGAVKSEVVALTGFATVYGLAGYQGEVYGFDESGKVLKIDTKTGTASVIATTQNAWWGAGVATRLLSN